MIVTFTYSKETDEYILESQGSSYQNGFHIYEIQHNIEDLTSFEALKIFNRTTGALIKEIDLTKETRKGNRIYFGGPHQGIQVQITRNTSLKFVLKSNSKKEIPNICLSIVFKFIRREVNGFTFVEEIHLKEAL